MKEGREGGGEERGKGGREGREREGREDDFHLLTIHMLVQVQ